MSRRGGIKIGGNLQPLGDSTAQQKETALEMFKRKVVPLSIYRFKDLIKQILENPNFQDSLATSFAFLSLGIAFPFFPLVIFVPLLAVVFILTYVAPLLGLMALLLLTLPMLIYQAPLLAWVITIIISLSLFLGYKHSRSIVYAYALAALSLSYLGVYAVIPGFVIANLVLGFKRSAIIATLVILVVIVVSALSSLPISGPIIYNTAQVHSELFQNVTFVQYLMVSKPSATLGNMASSFSLAFSTLLGSAVSDHLFNAFYYAGAAIAFDIQYTLPQILLWIFVAFSVSNYAVKSRSNFKGTTSSLFSVVLVASALVFSYFSGVMFDSLLIVSFLITPALIFVLEVADINVVQALDQMKQDILGKFGVALQDLSRGNAETFNDVANYEETKRELKQSILAPIEHREISGAYRVNPAKGILLFGPPGTGKTLIMRPWRLRYAQDSST